MGHSSSISSFILAAAAIALAAAGTSSAERVHLGPTIEPRDISGVWFAEAPKTYDKHAYRYTPMEGGDPPLTPEGRAIYDQRHRAGIDGAPIAHPGSRCIPDGVPMVPENYTPFQIIQTPGQVTLISEANHVFRIFHLDQDHPEKLRRTFMGHSVARWDGDTLIVDTVGQSPDNWLANSGLPVSDQLHIVERYRKIDGGKKIERLFTVSDPKMYTRDWTVRREYLSVPDERIAEEICEESQDFDARIEFRQDYAK